MFSLNIKMLPVGYIETNCYVVWNNENRDSVIIDPGGSSDAIIDFIAENGLKPLAIIDTHGHADHIGANAILKDMYKCPIYIHENDAEYLTDPSLNLSAMLGFTEPISPPPDKILRDGDMISAGSIELKVIHTPGHTQGGICLYDGVNLFAGDTLFAGGIGRTDFPRGSYEDLIKSIQSKLMVLPDDTVVYPGHGPSTDIRSERNGNPWLS